MRLLSIAEREPGLKRNPLAGFAMLLAPSLVDRAVDAFVTPDAIAEMVTRGRAEPELAVGAQPEPRQSEARARISRGYKDLDTFVVASISRADPSERVEFTFSRVGLFSWRLTRIGLPPARVARTG